MKRAAENGTVWGQPDTLDELRFHWGGAYDIAASGDTFTARRRDGRGDQLADPLPERLRRLIRADYEAMPVPRLTMNIALRPREPSSDDERALDILTLAWGQGYEIWVTAGEWQAWHHGAQDHEMLAGATPEELNAAIRADATHRSAL
jgi:hypothetical protein